VGAIAERGRLPASTRLATGLPSSSGANEKSVSSLLSRKPLRVIRRLPKASSIVVVIATALPYGSTMEICDVDGNSSAASCPQPTLREAPAWAGGVQGIARPSDLVVVLGSDR